MSPADVDCSKRISTSDGDRSRRRDRQDRKRKKEDKEDASRKKHKSRHVKGKDNHHHHHRKSSAKKKSKKRISKRKSYTSSDSSSSSSYSSSNDSSTSSSSSRSTERNKHHHHKRHNLSRRKSAKRRNRDGEERLIKSGVKDHCERSKDGELPNSPVEGPKLDKMVPKLCQENFGFKSKLPYHGRDDEKDGSEVIAYETAEEGSLTGKKDLSLEMTLRQKALANFMKHQVKTVDHKESRAASSGSKIAICTPNVIDSIVNADDISKNRDSSYVDADRNDATLISNKEFVKFDAKLGEKSLVAIPSCINNVVDAHLEGGVIRAEMYSGNTYSSSASLEKDQEFNERVEVLNHEGCREEGKLKFSSNLQEEGLGVSIETQPAGSTSRSDDLQYEQKDITEHKELKGSQTAAHLLHDKVKGIILTSQEVTTAGTAINENSKVIPMDDVSQIETDEHQSNNTGFQQKTMSVMKGGEMVQVNYKVYIPKRAAELARRRIQR